jgi:trk system potassium uptake protein
MKKFAVLGLGQFGMWMARTLVENNAEVLAMDRDHERVEAVKDSVTMAVIGNAADRATFDRFINKDFECVIVSFGNNLEDSVLATLYAKETGIANVITEAGNEDHGKILGHIGATRVVYPSAEIARRLATSLTRPNLLDYLPIHKGYSLMEIAMPPEFAGKTLRELDLRRQHGVMVIAIKEAGLKGDFATGTIDLLPAPDVKLKRTMALIIVGKDEAIQKLSR